MKSAWRLITTGLPLGLSSAIGSVQANVPRYVIASFLGPAMLARFAAISYITLAGHLVVNATSQAALPMLAKDAQIPGSRYQTHLGTLVAGTFVLGALVLSAAYLFGRPILTFVYGDEYTDYAGVLFWLVAATVVTFASVFLGTGTAARRRFGSPFLISAMSLVVVAASTPPLVGRYGLYGAAWALVAGAIAEFAAYAALTVRDLKGHDRSRPSCRCGRIRRRNQAMTNRAGGLRVLNVFGQMERGGAELRAVELAEAFPPDRLRSDFLVLTGLDGVLDDRVRAAGGEVLKCRLDPSFPGKFYRLLRERRYDVVHSHVHYFSGVILSLARLAGIRGRVSHLHTARINDREETYRRSISWRSAASSYAGTPPTSSPPVKAAMIAAWGSDWRDDSRCRVIYNSIRSDRLSIANHARAERPTIVNVASVKPLKNQARLIQMLRRMTTQCPGVQLQLIGKEIGDYGQEVRRAAAAAGVEDRVVLVGEVEDAMPWLAGADLMILPSAWEGLPCAVLEACAVGTPVLASDLPGTREIARHLPLVI